MVLTVGLCDAAGEMVVVDDPRMGERASFTVSASSSLGPGTTMNVELAAMSSSLPRVPFS